MLDENDEGLFRMDELTQDLWLPKEQAAHFLGVSTRQIERRHREGLLRKRTLPKAPGDTARRVVYSRVDLEAVKGGVPNRPTPEQLAKAQAVSSDVYTSGIRTLSAAIEQVVGRMAPPATSAASRPWLTLEEASEYSGLPAAFLLRQARAGVPWAVNVGSDKSVRWRFNRDALARPIAPAGWLASSAHGG